MDADTQQRLENMRAQQEQDSEQRERMARRRLAESRQAWNQANDETKRVYLDMHGGNPELAALSYAFDRKRQVDIFVAPAVSVAAHIRATPRGLW